jgi:putrescine transport system permease protein
MSSAPAVLGKGQLLARVQAWLALRGWRARSGVIAVPYLWLLLFFLVPFVIVLKIAFSDTRLGSPPYQPLLQWAGDKVLQLQLNLGNFMFLVEDSLYWKAYLNSLWVATAATALCLLIGYPMAYALARTDRRWRNGLLMLVVLPFWTSLLLRVYAWIGLLRDEGLINSALLALGVIREPIVMLQTDFAIYVGIVYSYLPFMILPLYANLEKMDLTLLEAAADLGCRPVRTFFAITVPLSMPGVIAGSLLVFIPAVGEYVIPELLGAPDALMIGKVLAGEFFRNRDWPVASAVAIALLLVLLLPLAFLQRAQAAEAAQQASDTGRSWPVRPLIGAAALTALGLAWWLFTRGSAVDLSALLSLLSAPLSLLAVIVAVTGLCFAVLSLVVRRFQVRLSAFNVSALLVGFAFLYVPILSMIVFSFNDSRLITSWAGFSLRWYQRLFENEQILSTAALSLQIATINATGAVILGAVRPLQGSRSVRDHDHRAAGDAGSDHRAVAVAAVHRHGGAVRLAGRAGRHDRDHRAHDVDHGLRHRDRALASGRSR